jgi:hypothetical protein
MLHPRRMFAWDEIIALSRPRFGIPQDEVHVLSKTGEKIILSRSMDGYSQLLELIQSKATNLSPREIWPKKSSNQWRHILIFLALFIVYVIAKLIFKF